MAMTMRDLVLKNRSYRRFDASVPIAEETLRDLVDLARQTPSARNAQPLRYMLACTPDRNAGIFPCLRWAGYLKDWAGPVESERPTGYIVVLAENGTPKEAAHWDSGIAAQTLLLAAVEQGLGGCMLGSVDRPRLRETLSIPGGYEIVLVLALGKPSETVVLEEIPADGDVKYYRDADGTHHVPKRRLDDVVLK